MIQHTFRFLCAGLLTTLVSTSLAAAATNAPATKPADKLAELFGDPVLAKGTGVEIKRSNLDTSVLTFKGAMAARGQVMQPADTEKAEPQLLMELIRLRLLLARATDADRTKGKELGEQRVKTEIERAGSEENVARQAKSIGRTIEDWKKDVIESSIAKVVLEREVTVTVTDDDVKKFYEDNPARFEEPEMVKVNHLLFATVELPSRQSISEAQKQAKRSQADAVLKRAKDGEDFIKLVKEYSDDTANRDKGGEMTFPRGQMMPELEAAAFALSQNQISDVVTTSFGYHIMKLIEKIPAKKIELAKVADRVKEALTAQAMQKQMPAYFEKLEKESPVEILDPKLKTGVEEAIKTAKTRAEERAKAEAKAEAKK